MGKPRARSKKAGGALNKEKGKNKGPVEYSVADILDRAEGCMDECQFPLAQKFCQRALELDCDNLRALQLRGDTRISFLLFL